MSEALKKSVKYFILAEILIYALPYILPNSTIVALFTGAITNLLMVLFFIGFKILNEEYNLIEFKTGQTLSLLTALLPIILALCLGGYIYSTNFVGAGILITLGIGALNVVTIVLKMGILFFLGKGVVSIFRENKKARNMFIAIIINIFVQAVYVLFILMSSHISITAINIGFGMISINISVANLTKIYAYYNLYTLANKAE